jgi:mRNA interferase HigB
VNIISKLVLFEKVQRHPDAKAAVGIWFDIAAKAQWNSLEEVREVFPATDMVGELATFNIRRNLYRLIVRMIFRYRRIYIKESLTHAEYDKGAWKKKWL